MSAIAPNRLTFMQGVLAARASSGQVIHYDELRRLCRLSRERAGEYLAQARRGPIVARQPDFCAVVVTDGGWPGEGWRHLASRPKHLRDAHNFWRDRWRLDNGAFEAPPREAPDPCPLMATANVKRGRSRSVSRRAALRKRVL